MTLINPCFSNDAADYLEANGYKPTEGNYSNVIGFIKGDLGITIYGDTIDFSMWHDEEPDQRSAHWSRYQSHTGISQLDEFGWILLFHIAGIVPLSEFKKNIQSLLQTA